MTTPKPTIVLVPGAWHFPECFDTFSSYLNNKGYETSKVALKSVLRDGQTAVTSHHEDVNVIRDHVQDLISQNKDVVVFAHSYGGFPTTEALSGLGKAPETHGVIRIIFCSAAIPSEGESLVDVVKPPDGTDGRENFARPGEDGVTIILIKEPMMNMFYHDVDPKIAEEQYSMLGAQSFGAWTTPVTRCAWREISSSYVVCKKDRVTPVSVQWRMAEKAGIQDVIEIDSSHSPFLSRPEELAEIMDRMIQKA